MDWKGVSDVFPIAKWVGRANFEALCWSIIGISLQFLKAAFLSNGLLLGLSINTLFHYV